MHPDDTTPASTRRGSYRQCAVCGNQFYVYPSTPKFAAARYCSPECWYNDPNAIRKSAAREIRTCIVCGKQYETLISETKNKRYCSAECYHAMQKGRPLRPGSTITVPCATCGTPVTRFKSQLRNYQKIYCSRQCKGKDQSDRQAGTAHWNWQGGPVLYYGPNWRRQTREARKRDNHTCQHCGITETDLGRKLDVHHIKPFRDFGTERYQEANRLSNLISLCSSCHLKTEPRRYHRS